jgi:hypothetical protein
MKRTAIDAIAESYGLMILDYGRSGSGKTSFLFNLFSIPGLLITNEPRGIEPLRERGLKTDSIVIATTPTEMYEAVVEAAATPGLRWMAIDTISTYYDQLFQAYCEDRAIPPDKVPRNVYNWCTNSFMSLWNKLLVATHAGLHVVVLCHEKQEQAEHGESNLVWFSPRLPGQLPEKILPQCAIVIRSFKIAIGGTLHYKVSVPDGNSYGKDWTGQITKPMPNDVCLLLGGAPTKAEVKTPADKDQGKEPQPSEPQTETENPPTSDAPPNLIIYNGKESTPDAENPVTQKDLRYLQSLCKEAGGNTSLLKTIISKKFGLKFLKEIRIKHMVTLTNVLTGMIDGKDVNLLFGEEGEQNATT